MTREKRIREILRGVWRDLGIDPETPLTSQEYHRTLPVFHGRLAVAGFTAQDAAEALSNRSWDELSADERGRVVQIVDGSEN